MKNSLFSRTRLIILLTVVLMVAFSFTSILSYNVTRESITRHDKINLLPLISDNIFSEIQKDLIQPINISSLMAHDEFLIEWVKNGEQDLSEIVRYLLRIRNEYGYFSTFFISDISSNYYYYDGVLKQINPQNEHDDWYYNFVSTNSKYDLDVDTDEATGGTVTIFINHRLEDQQGNFLGVTGVGLKMDTIGATLAEYQEKYDSLIYMADKDGLIQVHPDDSLVLSVYLKDLEGIGGFSADILENRLETNIYEYTDRQQQIVISTRYFEDFNWFLIVQRDETDALKTAKNYMFGNFTIGILVTGLVITLVILSINLFHQQLNTLATTDHLTNLFNRRKFQELFQREISIAKRFEQPLSLLLIDVDYFKSVNDYYGHAVGDRYLQALSKIFKEKVRDIDVVGRWGGEEFVVLLPKTGENEACLVAERLKQAAAAIHVNNVKGSVSRTVSIGAVSTKDGNTDMETMIKTADQAMYQAKIAGRNRTSLAKIE